MMPLLVVLIQRLRNQLNHITILIMLAHNLSTEIIEQYDSENRSTPMTHSGRL